MAHHLAWVGYHTGGSRSKCWLLSSESVQPACATVSAPVVFRRANTSPRSKHTLRSQSEFHPSISAELLTIAVCTHADLAERASMVSIRTVVIVMLDSGRKTSAEIRYSKTLTIVEIARLFELWRRDAASYQCGKACGKACVECLRWRKW